MRQSPIAGAAALLLFLAWTPLFAQPCNLQVRTDTVVFNLDANCQRVIAILPLLGPGNTCTDSLSLEIFTQGGVLIPSNTATGAHIGQVLTASITHANPLVGNKLAKFRVVDNIDPVIVVPCVDVTISCNADTSFLNHPQPSFMDNCDPSPKVTRTDQYLTGNCPTNPYRILRRFTATDASGKSTSCVQTLTMNYRDITLVSFPADITLDNMNPYDLNKAGQPMLDGEPLSSGPFCDFQVTYQDSLLLAVKGVRRWRRTWLVTSCTGSALTDPQILLVRDPNNPVIECPNDTLLSASSTNCFATYTLPPPDTAFDTGSGVVTITTTAGFGNGFGPHNIPVGTHVVTYTATDAVGNTATCTMTVTVQDLTPPQITCSGLSVNVQPDGKIDVPASSFLNAASDNCGILQPIRARRPPGLVFTPFVTFTCDDIGKQINVVVRVNDVNGLSNECTVQVVVQDKLAPTIFECPGTRNLSCEDYTGDPNDYGVATFTDNCGITSVGNSFSDNRNKCGIGEIVRTFIATDASGNTGSCTQILNVIDSKPLSDSLITWPEDYMVKGCTSKDKMHPDSIPEPYNRPVVDGSICSIIAIGYKDETLTVADPSCFKIFRTWTVVDCCIYDPGEQNPQGIFTYTQLIKVMDNEAPIINCPDSLKVSVGANCTVIFANLPDITAEDCNPSVKITNNSPFSIQKGPNASGNYPLGTTPVTFTANDQCGNFSQCKTKVVVSDFAAPTPLCLYGLTTDIGICEGDTVVKIMAEFFNQDSYDNCTPDNQLVFSFSEDTSDNTILFTCSDLDTNFIELWVTDAAGNQDFCRTYVTVQDNFNLCPKGKGIKVGGTIASTQGGPLAGVEVSLQGGAGMQTVTDAQGQFLFQGLEPDKDYLLSAEKKDKPLQGVSTYDLLLIQKHLLGIKTLQSAHHQLAADVNMSGGITISDIVLLRKWILAPKPDVSPLKAWRFLNPAVPMSPTFNPGAPDLEKILIKAKQGDILGADLTALKVGDISGDAFNTLLDAETRNNEPLVLAITDREFRTGDLVEAQLAATDFQDVQSLQFAMGWDAEALHFDAVQTTPNELLLDAGHFGIDEAETGLLRMSWSDPSGKEQSSGSGLFKVVFRARRDGRLSEFLRLDPQAMPPEAVTAAAGEIEQLRRVRFDWREAAPEDPERFVLYQNRPNPFRDLTMIGFRLPQSSEVILSLYTPDGRTVTEFRGKYPPGYHEITVPGEILPPDGVIFYRLDGEGFTETRKMIRQ